MEGLVRVSIVQSRGRFYTNSPDIRGLFVTGYTREEVVENIPEAIMALYAAAGMEVSVKMIYEDEVDLQYRVEEAKGEE